MSGFKWHAPTREFRDSSWRGEKVKRYVHGYATNPGHGVVSKSDGKYYAYYRNDPDDDLEFISEYDSEDDAMKAVEVMIRMGVPTS